MPFVNRDGEGNITGAFARPQYKGQEGLPADHPELTAFRDKIEADLNRESRLIDGAKISAETRQAFFDAGSVEALKAALAEIFQIGPEG